MTCRGGGPPQWKIDLESQEENTKRVYDLRQWLNQKLVDENYSPVGIETSNYHEFDAEFNEANRLNSSMVLGKSSSYDPSRAESIKTKNEEHKLCHVIRTVGENALYAILDKEGIKSKNARLLAEFWEAHKKEDQKRLSEEYKRAENRKHEIGREIERLQIELNSLK